ncbi:MAG: PHP domain-containing protein, partial [Steroidobacteraceae bacterium]
MTGFVHLRLHTEYSLVDGVIRVDALMGAVAAAGMPAVAVTDRSNLFALVKFHSAAQKAGIKPLIGVDLLIGEPEGQGEPSGLTLLVQDAKGFRNLTRLISRAWQEGQHSGQPVVERSWLTAEAIEGLLALSGGREGDVGRALLAGRRDEALALLRGWQALFGDRYYLEVSRTGREHEEACIEATLDLIRDLPTAIVATNDVRFIAASDFEAHEARVCIHGGQLLDDPSRPRRYSAQQYLKTPEEMARLFADLPEALENTVEVARRC